MKIIKIALLLSLIFMCGVVDAQSNPDTSFHLYVLMGQSNMAGRGPITNEYINESNTNVLMLNKNNEWVIARHPLHFDKPAVAGVGPGLTFGISMAEASLGKKIGLIPCAVGGTPIAHWVPGAYDSPTKTHPYDDAVIRIMAAMQSGVIKGIIWHQGESDSSPVQTENYIIKLEELIQRIRTIVGNPQLPFIIGQLGQYRPAYVLFNQELDKLPALVPYTGIVSSDGLVHKGDTTHFNSPSAEEIGKRYAIKMQEVQHENTP